MSENNVVVKVRPESQDNPELMAMLRHEVTAMLCKLNAHRFPIYQHMATIWIKEYNGKFYPKIEFDINRQELQYDMNADGTINEVHFKSFEVRGNKHVRVDLVRDEACPELIRLDTIIRFTAD